MRRYLYCLCAFPCCLSSPPSLSSSSPPLQLRKPQSFGQPLQQQQHHHQMYYNVTKSPDYNYYSPSSLSSTSSLSTPQSSYRSLSATTIHSTASSSLSTPTSTSDRETQQRIVDGVPKGLINLGNTCYMNAALQSLYSCDIFKNALLKNSSSSKPLCSELSSLFKQMKTSTTAVSPSSFKYVFSRQQSKFSGYSQQDAQEFLRYLINGIHKECNLAAQRPKRFSSSSTSSTSSPVSADQAWYSYREKVDDSFLVDIVVGQFCSTICCSVCRNKSNCWDPFWDLSLPIAKNKYNCKLSDLLDDFTAKETLDYDERPICEKCKCPTRSTKQISFQKLPKLLILHLKKFSNDGYKMTNAEVKIEKQLNIDGIHYQLQACVSHHGFSSSSGHYTSYCRYNYKWYHFDDARVRDVTNSFEIDKLSDAYVLFYIQRMESRL